MNRMYQMSEMRLNKIVGLADFLKKMGNKNRNR
jgi:hypothetical protein